MLDSNVSSYLVEEGEPAIQQLRRNAAHWGVQVVACPAVVYEALRTGNARLRRQLVRATTLQAWSRPMPEAYMEAAEVYRLLLATRPDWVRTSSDTPHWYRLQADWSGGNWWRRARNHPSAEAARINLLGGDDLGTARKEAKRLRGWALESKLTPDNFDPSTMKAGLGSDTSRWRGELLDAWRIEGCGRWWNVLRSPPATTPHDWLAPWIEGSKIRRSVGSWNELWFYEVAADQAPLAWLRATLSYVQMLRKVSDGTPVDSQIGTYLPAVEHFATADRRFIDAVESVRERCPVRLAEGHPVAASTSVLEQLNTIMRSFTY